VPFGVILGSDKHNRLPFCLGVVTFLLLGAPLVFIGQAPKLFGKLTGGEKVGDL
jgi:hypothetical protein